MTRTVVSVGQALAVVPETWRTLVFAATAWDPSLRRGEHADVARTRTLNADNAWACESPDGHVTCAWLTVNEWDTDFFGSKMALCGLEGDTTSEAIHTLLPRLLAHADAEQVAHIRISQRSGDPRLLYALQSHGFRVSWASVQIVCDTRSLDAAPPIRPDGLKFVPATEEHLPALLAAAEQLPAYNWLEFEPALRQESRARYLVERIQNCIHTPYADTCLVALWRGRPVGFHATAMCHHQAEAAIGLPFAYARETFVAPDAPPRLGVHLLKAALQDLRVSVRHVTGRVRLDGLSMLNSALTSGYTITGDEILLTRAVN